MNHLKKLRDCPEERENIIAGLFLCIVHMPYGTPSLIENGIFDNLGR
jgi:hypothetical protein